MIPATDIWNCPQLVPGAELLLGKSDGWVALVTGAWSVQLKIDKDGRFPRVDDLFRSSEQACSRLHLDPADARYLLDELPRLPAAQDPFRPITLDLNSRVAIRAADDERTAVAELTLSNSQSSGAPIAVSINRNFLLRAATLGFTNFHVFSSEAPLQCSDLRRNYLWAVLSPEGVIKAVANPVTITSPLATQDAATVWPPSPFPTPDNEPPCPPRKRLNKPRRPRVARRHLRRSSPLPRANHLVPSNGPRHCATRYETRLPQPMN